MEDDAMRWTGGCLCGGLRFEAAGPLRVHYCHCSMCRKATGSAFAVLAWLGQERLRWLGDAPTRFRSSPIAERGFCPACGSSLTLRYDGRDDIALHAGTLDHAEAAVPRYHYGIEGRLPWVDCGTALPTKPTAESW